MFVFMMYLSLRIMFDVNYASLVCSFAFCSVWGGGGGGEMSNV